MLPRGTLWSTVENKKLPLSDTTSIVLVQRTIASSATETTPHLPATGVCRGSSGGGGEKPPGSAASDRIGWGYAHPDVEEWSRKRDRQAKRIYSSPGTQLIGRVWSTLSVTTVSL